MKQNVTIDIIMLSKLGKKDGGRETWLYNFLPELLKYDTIARVNIYGFRLENDQDNTQLLQQLDPADNNRIHPYILVGKQPKINYFVSMFTTLRKFLKKHESPTPDYTIAVGGVFETLLMVRNKRFLKSTTITWLRTIFTHEKAYVIPSFLRSTSRVLENYLLKKPDLLIANGADTKKFYEGAGHKVHEIGNAINLDKWATKSLKETEVIEVAYIGRLSEVKGIKNYLDLAKRIAKGPNSSHFKFHIVGDPNVYEEHVLELDQKGIVIFHGAMDNEKVPSFLERIHVCVALTFVSPAGGGAGLSNALLEQMAAEKILLAWSNPAFNQILTEKNSYLVEQYSLQGLHDSLIDIYEHQEKALLKAKEAKKSVQPHTMENHVKKFLEVVGIN